MYIQIPDKNHHCFYQAVLTSLHEYISDLEGFHKYTAVHLKYQMLIHLIENLHNTKLMKQIFDQAWYKIICLHACPKAWILKFLHTKEWGDAKSMLGLIANISKLKITLINYLGCDAEFVAYGPYEGEGHADICIIYNGWSHYTATGTAAFVLHTHTHAHTIIIEIRFDCMLDFKYIAFFAILNHYNNVHEMLIDFFTAPDDQHARGANEDDEKKRDKTREALEEQRCKEKEDWLKKKVDEKKAGTAPPPVKRTKSTHGAAITSETKVCIIQKSTNIMFLSKYNVNSK